MNWLEVPTTLVAIRLGEWITLAILVVGVLGHFFNTIQKKMAEAQRPPARPQGDADRMVAAGPVNPRDEVERFLREVTARRQAAADRQTPPPLVEVVRPVSEPPRKARPKQQQRRKPARSRGAAAPARPQELEAVQAELVHEELGAGVRTHVTAHLAGSVQLGQGVRREVAKMLDHQVGTITHAEALGTGTHANALLGLLRQPQVMRRWIVLSEVLSPPVSLRPPS